MAQATWWAFVQSRKKIGYGQANIVPDHHPAGFLLLAGSYIGYALRLF